MPNSPKDDTYDLDLNHTHFVLIDDASEIKSQKFGQEIEFRTKLEVALMNKCKLNGFSGVYVISGGPNTLRTIANALFESINVFVFEVIALLIYSMLIIHFLFLGKYKSTLYH